MQPFPGKFDSLFRFIVKYWTKLSLTLKLLMSRELCFINLAIDSIHYFKNNVTDLTLFLVWSLYCTLISTLYFTEIILLQKKIISYKCYSNKLWKWLSIKCFQLTYKRKSWRKPQSPAFSSKLTFDYKSFFIFNILYLSVLRTFWVL